MGYSDPDGTRRYCGSSTRCHPGVSSFGIWLGTSTSYVVGTRSPGLELSRVGADLDRLIQRGCEGAIGTIGGLVEAQKSESPECGAQGSELRSTERTETDFTSDALPVNETERNLLLLFAREAVELGFSVVPTAPREKRPAVPQWHIYQKRLPTREEIERWFSPAQEGVGLVTGAVSGNVEALDFDTHESFATFCEVVCGLGYGPLLDHVLDGYLERSPKGAHALYKCETIEGNKKLANAYDRDESSIIKRTPQGKPILKAMIETRGEGGVIIIAPSHGATHPSGEPYTLERGGLATVATITPEERDTLLSIARSLDEIPKAVSSELGSKSRAKESDGTRPGDLFNARAIWAEILEPHGWRLVYERGGTVYWRRPGKDEGVSATTNHAGSDLLYVFTSSSDFDSERGYSKFSAYTLLNHDGDFSKTAEELSRRGYRAEKSPGASYRDPKETRPLGVSEEAWPVLADEAFYGLAGDIVRTIDPYTEADKSAVLVTLLVMFGNCVNANAHFLVEYTKHFVRLFVALVGRTAKGRKGQSLSTLRYVFEQIDPDWSRDRVVFGGLSSGEGLIDAVRDQRRNDAGEIIDQGELDKRLLLVEEELVSALKVASREGNTLSAILRQAWDRGDLRPLTKNNKIRATGAHISIVSHITQEELLRYLTATEQSNGFGNRFIWVLVKRSKLIPRPVPVPTEILAPLIERLRLAIDFARRTTVLDRDTEAEARWEAVYPTLSEGKPGMFGAIIGRAEVQVMRLACLYALLDHSTVIKVPHLEAALALWDYSEDSARSIFSDRLGDPASERLLQALRSTPEGLSDKEINDQVFARNKPAGELARIKKLLLSLGLVRSETKQDTGGRPETVWMATN
ncbi:MAG: DUF3987 domain-containing protein [Deltaproteobacteria bacterium]|nr:DUF3987 domain-containing protein [Deltaproteobacteria bacterium]